MCMNQSGFFPEFFDLPLLIAVSMFLVYYLMACFTVWITTSDATVCCPENSNPALHGTVSSTTVPDRFVVTVTSHWWYWKMTLFEAFSFLFVYEASSSKELHRKSGMWPKLKKNPKIPIFIRCLTLISLTQQKYKVDKFIACKMFEMYFYMVFCIELLFKKHILLTHLHSGYLFWILLLNHYQALCVNDI